MIKNTAFIVIIAFPDVIVRVANGELLSKLWPLLGAGGKEKIMAGHAAMLLVSKETGKVGYYDFGRYITSDKNGRVRSEETDNEVHIPIKAIHDNDEILNLNEILLFLDKHPEKTHGEGRMVIGVNSEIDYAKANEFIARIQNRGEVPYGAFLKGGSNCARFVTDTLMASTSNKDIVRSLKRTYAVTPSPVSNVIKGSSVSQERYEVENQVIVKYLNNSLYKEYKKSLFAKVDQEIDEVGSIEPNLGEYRSVNGQWLGGIGSGAWFEISEKCKDSKRYKVIRRNHIGEIELEADFDAIEDGFSIDKKFEFQYGSHCKQCSIKQNNKLFVFKRVMSESA